MANRLLLIQAKCFRALTLANPYLLALLKISTGMHFLMLVSLACTHKPLGLGPKLVICLGMTKDVLFLCSAKWQERNAALDEVENILKSSGGRIQPTVNNLVALLKVSLQLLHSK
jgi:hypothetical protein